MIQLAHSLSSWGSKHFNRSFIDEVTQLPLQQLPLQQAMSVGNFASKHNLEILINQQHEDNEFIYIKCGIFFSSLISGCNCADDPTPIDYNTEYCEMLFKINKKCGDTHISIQG